MYVPACNTSKHTYKQKREPTDKDTEREIDDGWKKEKKTKTASVQRLFQYQKKVGRAIGLCLIVIRYLGFLSGLFAYE